MLELVTAPSRVTVEVITSIAHMCPYRAERDEGTITISWLCDGDTFELHSLAAYLDTWATLRISHESLVASIKHDLEPLIPEVSVEAVFSTAGMDVHVKAGEDV